MINRREKKYPTNYNCYILHFIKIFRKQSKINYYKKKKSYNGYNIKTYLIRSRKQRNTLIELIT